MITYDLKGKKISTIDTTGGPIRILSRADLIKMKRASARLQDIEDAKALEKLS